MNLRSKGAVTPSRHVVLSTFVLTILCSTAQAAFARGAQETIGRVQQTAAVTVEAPIFLLPENTRKPLRILPPGTSLVVIRIQGDWLQVTFTDPQFGRRTGWIEQKFVRVNAPQPLPPEPVAPGAEPRTPAVEPRAPEDEPVARKAPQASAAPAVDRGGVGFRGFFTVTYDKMSASESFKAVTEKDTATFFGGGLQITNLWQGLFVEGAVERSSLDGERAFVGPNDEVFRLGIPLKVTMTPVDVVVGWRTAPVSRAWAYGAGGISFLEYEETSDFADADENVKERYRGLVLLGGIEYSALRFVHIRGEIRYRRFANAIGVGGVSAVFDETDLGSFGAALKIAIGR